MQNVEQKSTGSCGKRSESQRSGFKPTEANPWVIKAKVFILCILGLVHLGTTYYSVVPGYINVDEAVYHWMTKGVSNTGEFNIWNGYDELRSWELVHPYVSVNEGKLFPRYPQLFPILAVPWYRMSGYSGLFHLNSLAFVGVMAFCFLIARRLFHDTDLALNSCLILLLATFCWEYSQAAWPHSLALFFWTAAFYFCILSFFSNRKTKAALFAALAGLTASLSLGIRADSLFVYPAILLLFVFVRPWRPMEAIAVLVGSIPGVGIMTYINYVKFGIPSPVSFGSDAPPGGYPGQEISIVIVVSVVLLWLVTRSKLVDYAKAYWKPGLLLVGVAFVISAISFPTIITSIETFLEGGYVSVIDIRALDPSIPELGFKRSSGGGVVSVGHRKALLQSLPFLAVLFIPLLKIARREEDLAELSVLFLVPVMFIGYYSLFFFDLEAGGLCLNMRYYLACLPFFAILTAYGLRELKNQLSRRLTIATMGTVLVLASGTYYFLTRSSDIDALEFPLLVIPLVLAGLLLFTLVGCLFAGQRWTKPLNIAGLALLTTGMVWAGLVAFLYDFSHHKGFRAAHYFYAQELTKAVPPDSIIFVSMETFPPAVALVEKNRVRIALTDVDHFSDFRRLVEFHSKANRRVFGFYHNARWKWLRKGPLKGYGMSPLVELPRYLVAEISGSSESGRGDHGFNKHGDR